jgi:DNA-binding transcriptional ArsR family regulator
MGEWRIAADALARSRFVVSPLQETVATVIWLDRGGAMPGLRGWAAAERPAFKARLSADPFAARLVESAFRATWIADFLITPPTRADRTFQDELRRVRETPTEVALADLALPPGAVPAELAVPDLAVRAADLLDWVWTRSVRPDWPRRRRLFEADIVARTQQLSAHGWADALAGMRPGLRWLGDGRLRINAYANPPRSLDDAELLFVPTTASGRGWVCWDEPERYAVIYPCSGTLSDGSVEALPEALSRLLGATRATILTELGTPKSTSQLVAATGHGLGSVGGHLKVLLDAGLVRRTRSGRSVLYYRTAVGDQLVEPAPPVEGTAHP